MTRPGSFSLACIMQNSKIICFDAAPALASLWTGKRSCREGEGEESWRGGGRGGGQ
jgi:hypothetical protein